MTENKPRLSRRQFLLGVGAGGAATAAAIVGGRTAGEKIAAQDRRQTRGYQVTAHVTNYYRTAKV